MISPDLHVRAFTGGTFRLVHLSDPHLTSLDGVACSELLNKRVLGYLSWLTRRRREHRREVLDCLTRDIADQQPNHVVITGDLTHVGTREECQQAATWLEALGDAGDITVVPGNHDCYAAPAAEDTVGLWQSNLRADSGQSSAFQAEQFPTLRVRGPLVLIGLNTGVPTAPFMATGCIDAAQLRRLEGLLERWRQPGRFRVVLIHHPPSATATSWRRRLGNADALGKVLDRHGAELLLHGHAHAFVADHLRTATGDIPVHCVPSASAHTTRAGRRAGYNIYDLAASERGWTLAVTQRQLAPAGDAFEVLNHVPARVPAQD